MAPFHSRQLLVWTLPTIAVLLSYLWYKKKRIGARSDPGDDDNSPQQKQEQQLVNRTLEEELIEAEKQSSKEQSTPRFSRSLSGVESTPIDIIIPPQLRGSKSTPIVISDEDLDFEIEKIKSMRNGPIFDARVENSPARMSKSKTSSPAKEKKNKKNMKKSPVNIAEVEEKATKVAGDLSVRKISSSIVVEEKLGSLKLNDTPEKRSLPTRNDAAKHDELQRQSSERDSANHSPSDVMLASPSLSSISDNHSEGSSDSGKGGSDVVTPPPSRTPGISHTTTVHDMSSTFYEFTIPQSLVGKMIGRQGSFINQIKNKTNSLIVVRKHPTNNKMKICSIEGTKCEVDNALKMIRDKFPVKRYPDITLEQVHLTPAVSSVALIPDYLYLKLVEGINNDTVLSCMVAPNHLFLQQPTHPTFPNLNVLSNCMNLCYTETDSPLLPNPVLENAVCCGYSVDGWYRAMVISSDVETETSYVKFLDYGGFAYVENSKLRQIRGDFLLLPFQAAECILANVKSINDDGSWHEEAYNLVAEVTKGTIMYTQVADYTEEGVPLVLCYIITGPQSVIFLNQHLVDNGFAEWLPSNEPSQQHENVEGAVGGVQI